MKTADAEITFLVEQVGAKVGIPVSCMHAAVYVRTYEVDLCAHEVGVAGYFSMHVYLAVTVYMVVQEHHRSQFQRTEEYVKIELSMFL